MKHRRGRIIVKNLGSRSFSRTPPPLDWPGILPVDTVLARVKVVNSTMGEKIIIIYVSQRTRVFNSRLDHVLYKI